MERSERARQMALEGALRRRADAIDRADEKALDEMRAAGFRFRSIGDAERYIGRVRELTRIQAELTAQIVAATQPVEEAA